MDRSEIPSPPAHGHPRPSGDGAPSTPEGRNWRGGTDLRELLAHMEPQLHPGRHVFVALPREAAVDPGQIVALVREAEGLSAIVPEPVALDLGLPVAFTAAWITLRVHSDLAAVGLTAAISGALARAGISCNVVAGVHHDHLFVPSDRAQQAMEVLRALSTAAAQGGSLMPEQRD